MNSMTKSNSAARAIAIPTWYEVLSAHLLAKFPQTDDVSKQANAQCIRNLGNALEQGDTCLYRAPEMADEAWLSHPLFVSDTFASVTPAPLVVMNDEQGEGGRYVYFYRHWQQEWQLAERLAALLNPATAPKAAHVDLSTETSLKALQIQAIEMAAKSPFSLITGGPGTGKTYTLARIVKALQQSNDHLRVALAAPTGKAAQRMQSVLSAEFQRADIGHVKMQQAQTIHRLLGLGGRSTPRYHRFDPLPFDLIIIDEGSMLDLALASLLFDAIAVGTRVIILGDADQLAAVDAGAVLADLGESDALKPYRVHLLESNRFKADEGIGLLANGVLRQDEESVLEALAGNEQVQYFDLDKARKIAIFSQLWQGFSAYVACLESLKSATHPLSEDSVKALFAAFDQYRVLCAQRYSDFGANAINQILGEHLQKALNDQNVRNGGWYVGRPVMVTRNDYGLRLSNGDIGVCLSDNTGRLWVYFPDRVAPIAATRLPPEQIETAFALTIHKSQGSEFSVVAMVLDASAEEMLTRELVYTAITRAKKCIQVWSDKALLINAIHKKSNRMSGLKSNIAQMLTKDH
ncbi:MAG: exodeoxyribonuclease V subunit alpha [Candidatus Saccharibacteria bacterium]|nr:exodeoxyribonuclease V subunit alpha [Moraxellaceae bacterium]